MEMVFLILSGAILLAGILYWFWSHLQLTQKKVQLLENAVFELRGMLTHVSPEPPVSSGAATTTEAYTDLSDDDWVADEDREIIEHVSTPLAALDTADTVTVIREGSDDALMPGGRMAHVSVESEEKTVDIHELMREEEQFRDLFVGDVAGTPDKKMTDSSVGNNTEALESMPVKELRRLAEQRGIPGATEMRKKEILSALRNQVGSSNDSGRSVEVERTMDLTEITEEMPVLE
jgi:hypothetical protein